MKHTKGKFSVLAALAALSIAGMIMVSCSKSNSDQAPSGKMTSDFTKEIKTPKGSLFLTYGEGRTLLSGTLERPTPCVDFNVSSIATRDFPTSLVMINIFNRNKGVNCIQQRGDPQEINEEIMSVSENTHYTVKFEDEELFSGRLGEVK